MTTYQYQCPECKTISTVKHSMKDDPKFYCCGAQSTRYIGHINHAQVGKYWPGALWPETRDRISRPDQWGGGFDVSKM